MILSTLLLLAMLRNVAGVYDIHAGRIRNDERGSDVVDFSNVERRTNAHLPKFSKKEKGKGISSYYTDDSHNEQEYVWVLREKSYKDSKKDKKDGKKDKKDKKEKYYWEIQIPTHTPTTEPISNQSLVPSIAPTLNNNNKSGSGSEDMVPTSSSSEDCPPERPPSVIPPSPTSTAKEAPVSAPTPSTQIDKTNAQHVDIDLYAVDYTLFQTDRTPIKVDFLELQKITENYFKDHMVDEYKVSTQANLIDFTTSFVTAHFTPTEPVHIQFNSTAYFDKNSVNIPTSEILYSVLKKSLENPKPYIDKLKSDLNNVNPFSSTTGANFTDPKATPSSRSASNRAKSVFGISSAGVLMSVLLSIFVCVVRRRKINDIENTELHGSFSKEISADTTVAGDTFAIESINSIYDSSISILTSIENKDASVRSNTERHHDDVQQTSSVIIAHRKPRSVAEIEELLMRGGGEFI